VLRALQLLTVEHPQPELTIMLDRKPLLGVVLAGALVVSGCGGMQPTKEQTGTVVGGVLGGVLGSQVGGGRGQTAATIIGAIAGGTLGGSLGRRMNENDRLRTAQALETTGTGEAASWRNPDTGSQYSVVPTRTYQAEGAPCRDYRLTTTIDGRPQDVTGTACRQPDGNWRAVG